LPDDEVGRMVGDGAATLIARAFDASHVARPPDALERFLAIYNEHLADFTRPYAGVRETLDALHGRAVLAVLTNKPAVPTRTLLEHFGLSAYFTPALVVGGDGPFPRKPDPTGLRHIMRTASVDQAATILVGDSLIDWRTARAAPTIICMARYGFGFSGFPADHLDDGDFTIDAPGELLQLVTN
jgi:phosphoglycolate phosphatase